MPILSRTGSNQLIQKTDAVMRRLRSLWYRFLGMQLASSTHLRRIKVSSNCHDIRIGKNTYLDDYVSLDVSGKPNGKIKIDIGANCGFNRFTVIAASVQIIIGEGTRVGPSVYITDHQHGNAADETLIESPTIIGRDVWLGADVKVMKGVTIGDQCIVGAGSVVTEDIPPSSIVLGHPARVIRKRV